MSDNIIINNRKLTISIKTVRRNGRTYSYYNTKVTLGKDPVTGKQKQRDFTGRTKEELIENLEKELGKPVLPPESSILLSTWLDTWMNTYAEMNLKPTTKANYQTGIELAIKPGIGDMPIRDLDEYNISRFYKNLDEQGKSTYFIRLVQTILNSALNYAVAKRYINFNPCKLVPLKKLPHVQPKIFTPKECVEFKKLVINDPHNNLFGLMMGTGMRIGEAMGLSWDCVDLDNGSIYIRNQITSYYDRKARKERTIWQTSPKTGMSHYIYISDKTIQYLKDEKMKQEKKRLENLINWNNEHNLVFTNYKGSHLIYGTVLRSFKAAVTLIGRPDLTPHSMRHTFASAAWHSTHNIYAIQEQLGHRNPLITAHYISILKSVLQEQASSVDAYLENRINITDFDSFLNDCPQEIFDEEE